MVLYTISVNAVNEDRAASGGQLPLSPTYWIFNIIACLMYAALPEGSGPEKPDTMDYRFLLPTVYAMASHPVNSAEMLKSDPVLYCQKVVRFSSGTPAFKIDIPAQFQPINNLDEWMPKIDIAIDAWKNRQAPVHNDWLEATLNTLQEIRAYRTANHSPALWANWNFRIPDYVRSDSWVHWAVSLNTWVFYDANTSNFQEGFNPSPRGVNPAPTSAGPIPMPGPIPMVEDCKRSAFLKYKYFTIASVVDNGWIVDPNSDDSTVDVYDLKGKLANNFRLL